LILCNYALIKRMCASPRCRGWGYKLPFRKKNLQGPIDKGALMERISGKLSLQYFGLLNCFMFRLKCIIDAKMALCGCLGLGSNGLILSALGMALNYPVTTPTWLFPEPLPRLPLAMGRWPPSGMTTGADGTPTLNEHLTSSKFPTRKMARLPKR
jgi:hypothetical protein